MQYNLSVSYTYGYNARPRTRRSRTDRVIPTRLTHPVNPLTECRVTGCHSVTTVGPLCLMHWEEKVNNKGQARHAAGGAGAGGSRAKLASIARRTARTKRWLVVLASGPAPAGGGQNSSGQGYTRRWAERPDE